MDRNKRITKPKYEIIKEALLERIRTGQFSSDAVFCTEKMLSEQYEVSRITAKRAIEDLEQQGILYRKRGVGSFVSQKIPGRFCSNKGVIAGYDNRIREKYTAKWDVQIAEMLF